jgi:hypothetical protein
VIAPPLRRPARAPLLISVALAEHLALAGPLALAEPPPRVDAVRAYLSAHPEARAVTRQEEGEIDWSAREVRAVGVGTPRLLSPTGGLATEDLGQVASRDAQRRLVALVGALLSAEGAPQGEQGACGGRLSELVARRVEASHPPARFSDGTAHLRARLALSDPACGEASGLPVVWVEAPAGALLAPLITPMGAPKGSVLRRFVASPASASARDALRAQVSAGAPLAGALEGAGEGGRLRVGEPLDGREVWVWSPPSPPPTEGARGVRRAEGGP